MRERDSEFCPSHPLECINSSNLSVQSQDKTGCARADSKNSYDARLIIAAKAKRFE